MQDRPLFGPAGNSESFYAEGLKHTADAPAWVKKIGLDAYEYQGGTAYAEMSHLSQARRGGR